MPEKPEVVTVARTLRAQLIGKTITDCSIYWDNIIASPTTDEFKQRVVMQKIQAIKTRGKWLILELEQDDLLIHLRMEGKFFFRARDTEKGKHEHVFFTIDDDVSFRFHDVRKFGKMYLLSKEEVMNKKPLCELGYEYDDLHLTKEYLYQKLQQKKIPIKTALLDQSIIAGIGNIYDDEILYLSKISPLRRANKVHKKECQSIIEHTKEVLDAAIQMGGTTIKSFTSSEGVHGLFQNELAIHGKEGTPCPNCCEKIVKIKVGGRGTYYCPSCQK